MSDKQAYTGNNHMLGRNFHMAVSNPSFMLIDGKKKWRTEWHYYFGPSVVLKNGDIPKKQPGERSRFWRLAVWWKDQGCVVVDGIGQWKEPAIIERRYKRFKGGLLPDENGNVVIRFYEVYEDREGEQPSPLEDYI